MEAVEPKERLRRMQAMFAEDLTILAEDYEHFTGVSSQDAAIRRNRGSGRSAESNVPRGPGRN